MMLLAVPQSSVSSVGAFVFAGTLVTIFTVWAIAVAVYRFGPSAGRRAATAGPPGSLPPPAGPPPGFPGPPPQFAPPPGPVPNGPLRQAPPPQYGPTQPYPGNPPYPGPPNRPPQR